MPQAPTPSIVNEQHAQKLALLTEKAALKQKYGEAEKFARELLEVVKILYGPTHLEVGIAQFYLALALEEQGRVAEAIKIRKSARAILLGQGVWRN
jgi:hypothetical protein